MASPTANPFDVADQIEAAQRGLMISAAAQGNPDQAAKAVQQGSQVGVPPDVSIRNPADVNRRATVQAAVQASESSPVVANWLNDPTNAAVGGAHEAPVLAGVVKSLGSIWGAYSSSFDQGLGSAVRGLSGDADNVAALFGQKTNLQASASKLYQPALDRAKAEGVGVDWTGPLEKAFSMVGGVAPAIISGPGAPAAFAGTGSDQYNQARIASGAALTPATGTAGLTSGAIQGGIAAIPFGKVAESLLPAFKNEITASIAKLGLGTALAGTGGAAMQVGANAAEKVTFDPNKDLGDGVGASAATMALFHAIPALAEAHGEIKASSDAAAQVRAQSQAFEQTGQQLLATKLPTRVPDRTAALLEDAAPGASVYLPAEPVANYLQSVPPEEAAKFVSDTGIGDQLEGALASGSKVEIPASQYLAKVFPTPAHAALTGDLSFSQDGISSNEAGAAAERADADIAAKGDQVVKDATTQAEAQQPTQAVYADALSKLKEQGVKGSEAESLANYVAARYEARAGVFNDGQAEPVTDAMQEYQRAGGGGGLAFDTGGAPVESRGNITIGEDGKTLIRLMGGRDKSTIPHELGHAFLEELQADAARPDAPDQLKADNQTVREWLGAQGDEPLNRDQHEQFARGHEAYLMEGRSPSEKLRGVFQRFKDWMTRIYRHTSALQAPLNDDVRGVYSRLIASQDAIKQAQSRDGAIPDFATPADGGMTAKEFGNYQDAVARAKQAAEEQMTAKGLNAVRRTRTKEWQDERAKMREAVAEDFDKTPLARAHDYLVNRKPLDGVEPVKLLRADVVDILGEDATKRLPRGKEAIYADEGAHPDQVAELTGHETGEGMLRELSRAGDFVRDGREAGDKRSLRDMAVDQETDSQMLVKHGDALAPDSIADAATVSIHNDLRAKVLQIEQKALERQAGEPESAWTTDQLKAYAEGVVGKQKTAKLRPELYLAAERKAARETQRSLLKGDKVEALGSKRRQVISFHLYRAAKAAETEMGAARKLLTRYAKRDVWKSMDQGYFNQISDLLSRFGFRAQGPNKPPPFGEWADELATEGVTVVAPAALRSPFYHPSFDDMSVEEARDVRDAVQSIAHLGRDAKTALVNGRRVQLDELADEVQANVQKSKVQVADDLRATRPTNALKQARVSLLRFETLMDMMDLNDPNGPFNRVLAHGASDANANEAKMQKEFLGDLHSAYNEVPWDIRRTWYRKVENAELMDPQKGQPMKFTKADVIGMALNSGTAENWAKLTEGFGWDEGATRDLINRTLTEPEFQFVQKVWNTLDPLYPKMADAEERLTGVRPLKVAAQPVETPFGTLEGGYYPLKYDPTRNARIRRTAQETFDSAFGRKLSGAATLNGAAQTRTGYRGPLTLSPEAVIFGHMRDVTKRIAWGEYVQSADRFLKHGPIEDAVNQRLGAEAHDQMLKYVRTSVGYNLTDERSMAWAEKFMRAVRTNGVTNIAGFNPRILAEHTAAHAQTVAVIGKEYWGRGLVEYASDMRGKGQFIFDRSPEMVARKEQANREIADLMSDLSQHQDWVTNAAAKAGVNPAIVAKAREIPHMPVSAANMRLVAMPAWIGGYRKALAEGMSEEDAIRYGDKVVRVSHSSGAPKDLPAVQQGNEFYKLFSTFFAYHANQWNLYERSVEGMRQASNGKDFARSLESLVWALPVAAMLGSVVSGRHPDDMDPAHWAEWGTDASIRALWAGLPVARNIGDAGLDVLEGKAKPRDAAMHVAPTTLVRPVQSTLEAGSDIAHMVQRLTGDPNATGPSEKWLQHLIEAPGYWLGLPLAAPARSAQYLKDVAEGRQQPQNPLEAIEGTLFGAPPKKAH